MAQREIAQRDSRYLVEREIANISRRELAEMSRRDIAEISRRADVRREIALAQREHAERTDAQKAMVQSDATRRLIEDITQRALADRDRREKNRTEKNLSGKTLPNWHMVSIEDYTFIYLFI